MAYTRDGNRFDDWWLGKATRAFGRMPPWAQGLFVVWALLGITFAVIGDLNENVPPWLGFVIGLPALLLILTFAVPVLVSLFLLVTWPVRKAVGLMRKPGQ